MKQEWQRSWSKGAWPAARTGTKRAWSGHVAGAASRAADWHGTEWQSNGSGDTWKRARARGSRGGQERRQEWVAGQSHGGGGPATNATCLAVVPWTAPVSVRPTQPLALTETAASSSAAATHETQVAVMPVDANSARAQPRHVVGQVYVSQTFKPGKPYIITTGGQTIWPGADC